MRILQIVKELNSIEKKIKKLVKIGIIFSLFFCLISAYILVTYLCYGNIQAYNIGVELLKSGLFFLVSVIVYGIVFNQIKKEI